MKVLVICQFYYPENFTITNVAESLSRLGHDVTVITGKPNYGYGYILPEYKKMKYQELNGVKIHRVNLVARKKSKLSIIINYLSFYFSSRRFVRHFKEEFDVVYSMSLSPVTILSPGNLYAKKHHVKHVVHCLDLWPESVLVTHAVRKDSLTYRFLYKWSKSLYESCDKVLISSPSFKDYFNSVLKINDKPIVYVSQTSLVNKVDLVHDYSNNKVNVLYCGNLGLLQNIDLISEAMNKVDKRIILHIIGMGPKQDKLVSDIEKYNIKDNVIYYGPMNAKRAASYFAGADLIYIPLKNEGTVGKTIPNKVGMAMAFNKPIIAMIKGDGYDVLKSANGSIFVEENASSLADGLNKFLTLSEEVKTQMGNNNKKYFDENFAEDKVAQSIEKELVF